MGKNNRRISHPKGKAAQRIKPASIASSSDTQILFSLERCIAGKYCFSSLTTEFKADFGNAIFRRRGLSWSEVREAPRHGIGTEKIAVASIKAAIPNFVTEEVLTLLALRFSGLSPMVGYRVGAIFYVLWFDHDFTLYDH